MSEGLGEWDDELQETEAASDPAEDSTDAPELFYPNVAEFVRDKLAVTYRRPLKVQGEVAWCPQWWKHAEAISRLEALWRAWEHLRLDGTTGMSVWWRDHADHHMTVLLSTDGPFKGCSPGDGHRARQASSLRCSSLSCSPPRGPLEPWAFDECRTFGRRPSKAAIDNHVIQVARSSHSNLINR